MDAWKAAAAVGCRLGSIALGLVLASQVYRAARPLETAPPNGFRIALTLLGLVTGIVVLQVVSYFLDLNASNASQEALSRTNERTRWDRIAVGVGALFLVGFGAPHALHLASAIPLQAVRSCDTGFRPRWYVHVELEGGALVPLGQVLEPDDGCVRAGASFEKRRWEEGYRIDGVLHPIDTRLRSATSFFIPLGAVLVVAGAISARRRRDE